MINDRIVTRCVTTRTFHGDTRAIGHGVVVGLSTTTIPAGSTRRLARAPQFSVAPNHKSTSARPGRANVQRG